jgi:ribosomal protein S18 acetylase RimI-like enzyme
MTGRCPQVDSMFEVFDRTRRVSTNFFASLPQVEIWAARHNLSWMETAGCLMIFRRSGNLNHVYHVTPSVEALSNSLMAGVLPKGVLVSDLVGRENDIRPIARAYEAAGFRPYATLVRMVRMVDDPLPGGEYPDVTFACLADTAAIRGFLIQLLDRFADQIPEEPEIRNSLARRNILIIRREERLGGLLIFDKKGLTSTLRYWYVSPEFRGQGIGARLIKSYFGMCRECRRILLWVARSNLASLEKYRHYGFKEELLMDQIMIRKKTIGEVLQDLRPEFDFGTSDDFIADGMLDSHDVVALVSDLDQAYGISIAGIDIIPENFQNIAAIEQLVRRYDAEL